MDFLRQRVPVGGTSVDVGANIGLCSAVIKGIVVAGIPLLEILTSRNVANVDGLKIDVEGFEDRMLTGFFKSAPRALWPGEVVIEHLSRSEWQHDCIENMLARGYKTDGRTRSNTLLILGIDP